MESRGCQFKSSCGILRQRTSSQRLQQTRLATGGRAQNEVDLPWLKGQRYIGEHFDDSGLLAGFACGCAWIHRGLWHGHEGLATPRDGFLVGSGGGAIRRVCVRVYMCVYVILCVYVSVV